MNDSETKIFFIGAGPGDPELLTIKAKRIIGEADIIIYAGSLVNRKILDNVKPEVSVYDSAEMSFDDVVDVITDNKDSCKTIARIHSGDPSLYGAIQEQMIWCEEEGIPFEVIPGVSSFCAASASLKQQLTLPGVSQSVILTRMSGRTKVPPKEELRKLAQIGATTIVFLSIDKIEEVVGELLYGYDEKTPIAVVYRASWPDEKIVRGALFDIAEKVKAEGIKSQALIFVGDVIGRRDFEKSKLYDKSFTHAFRKGR